MIYLDTRHCGYDLERMGFPSVETCMALVLETNDYLVGWHCPSCSVETLRETAVPFASYVQRMGTRAATRLYGVTHTHRGGAAGAKVSVPAELRIVAGALDYHGPVTYVLLEAQRPDYIEFHRIGGGSQCEIYYKNSGKVDYAPGHVATTKTRHHSIKPGSDVATRLYGGDNGIAPIVIGVTAKAGALKMHELGDSTRSTFVV